MPPPCPQYRQQLFPRFLSAPHENFISRWKCCLCPRGGHWQNQCCLSPLGTHSAPLQLPFLPVGILVRSEVFMRRPGLLCRLEFTPSAFPLLVSVITIWAGPLLPPSSNDFACDHRFQFPACKALSSSAPRHSNWFSSQFFLRSLDSFHVARSMSGRRSSFP